MNTQWTLASSRASRAMKWYDLMAIGILAAGALLAVLGWVIFDGTRAL
jgi:hypothetical protein